MVLSFKRNQQGTVAIIFALFVIPICLSAAFAVDGGRAYFMSQKLTASTDAAALSAARALYGKVQNDDQIIELARTHLLAHMSEETKRGMTIDEIRVEIDRSNDRVTVTADARLDTHLARIVGVDRFDMTRTSSAIFDSGEVELSLMLDVSGSMSGNGKISSLKHAVRDLIDILIPESDPDEGIRIGVAPYSNAVNAGDVAAMAKGKPKSEVNPCVSERKGANAFKETPPNNGTFMGDKATSCPANAVKPLTDDRNDLLSFVNSLSTGGSTAGHLGTAWAWYIVSPEWAQIWPSESKPKPYGETKLLKATILMTDGMYNTEYESTNGNSTEQAVALCTSMKAKGIKVFTVGFQAPPDVIPTLQACASSHTDFFDASDEATLRQTFREIANRLTVLRIEK